MFVSSGFVRTHTVKYHTEYTVIICREHPVICCILLKGQCELYIYMYCSYCIYNFQHSYCEILCYSLLQSHINPSIQSIWHEKKSYRNWYTVITCFLIPIQKTPVIIFLQRLEICSSTCDDVTMWQIITYITYQLSARVTTIWKVSISNLLSRVDNDRHGPWNSSHHNVKIMSHNDEVPVKELIKRGTSQHCTALVSTDGLVLTLGGNVFLCLSRARVEVKQVSAGNSENSAAWLARVFWIHHLPKNIPNASLSN